ncbi:hypothetical protein A4A49_28155 [Nicotiana attenuata]|uniref:Uncharacterized protein n=1 Tax=Nicotiana attenuata TaxID=49451 RepID=A0A1J6ITZ3_NICAT|nr:hypothetical protein A4A49_28155 [Nicotiana attenuata]
MPISPQRLSSHCTWFVIKIDKTITKSDHHIFGIHSNSHEKNNSEYEYDNTWFKRVGETSIQETCHPYCHLLHVLKVFV